MTTLNEKHCEIELNIEEVKLLRNLLKVEPVYQVRAHIANAVNDPDHKTLKVINVFDTYNLLDNQLTNVLAEMKANTKDESLNNLVLIDKKVARVYHLLVAETGKILSIPLVKDSFDKLSVVLLAKINACLGESTDPTDKLPINMGGVGLA